MRGRIAGPVAALAALLLVGGCKDGPTGPEAGVLTLALTLDSSSERAIVVSVSGPGEIGTVESASPAYTVHSRVSGASFRAAVFGNLASGPLVRFAVPDVADAKSYTAIVLELADSSNTLRPIAVPTLTIVK